MRCNKALVESSALQHEGPNAKQFQCSWPQVPSCCFWKASTPPQQSHLLLRSPTCPSLYHCMVGLGTAQVLHSNVTVLLTLVFTSSTAYSPKWSSLAIQGGTRSHKTRVQ